MHCHCSALLSRSNQINLVKEPSKEPGSVGGMLYAPNSQGTKQNKTKQNKTKQNKTKQNKTKHNTTKQNKTKENRTKQNN